jgi:hypothetical protein
MTDFASAVQSLAAKEAVACRKDPTRFPDMIETLARALGFSVALAAEGDGTTIAPLLEGATAYAHGEAVDKAPLAALSKLMGSRRL